MAEEGTSPNEGIMIPGEENVVAPQLNTHEDKARQSGWKPQEEWDGDPDDWVDAKTFNQRGEYLERIKSQSSLIKKIEKKLGEQEKTIKELAEYNRNIATIEREKALKELKNLKKEALDLADHDKVIEIDDRIAELQQQAKQQQQQEIQEKQEPELDPAVVDWIEENPWYENDPALQGAVNGLVAALIKKDPELKGRPRDVLEQVTAQLKEEFPHKFSRRTRSTSPVTESVSNNSGSVSAQTGKTKYTAKHLNEEQRKTAQRFIKAGAIKDMQQYVDDLAAMNFLDVQQGGSR